MAGKADRQAFYDAIIHNDHDVIRMVLAKKPSWVDFCTVRPVCAAVYAHVHLNGDGYFSPIDLALRKSSDETVLLIESLGAKVGPEALVLAVQRGRLEILRAWLPRKVEKNSKLGQVLLCTAAAFGRDAIVYFLLRAGYSRADVPDEKGMTALDYAREHNRPQIVARLTGQAARREDPAGTNRALVNRLNKAENEKWMVLGEQIIGRRVDLFGPDCNRRVLDIFNFATQERMVLSQNKTTQQEAVLVQGFDSLDFAGTAMVRRAEKALLRKSM